VDQVAKGTESAAPFSLFSPEEKSGEPGGPMV